MEKKVVLNLTLSEKELDKLEKFINEQWLNIKSMSEYNDENYDKWFDLANALNVLNNALKQV